MQSLKSKVGNKVFYKFWSNQLWQIFRKHGCRKILDAGCGMGWFGKNKPNKSVEVWGIDTNKDEIKIAKKYEHARVGNIRHLPYRNGFFDGVLASHIIEHIPENIDVVKEFYRVLRKGGLLVAESPSPWHGAWDDPTHVRPYTVKSFSKLAEDAGFKVIECCYLGRGIPGFGKLGLWSASHRIGKFFANRLHVRRGHVFMVCKK